MDTNVIIGTAITIAALIIITALVFFARRTIERIGKNGYRGVSETGKIGAFFTLGQTLFLVFIGAIGIVKAIIDPSLLQKFVPFLPHGWNKLLICK